MRPKLCKYVLCTNVICANLRKQRAAVFVFAGIYHLPPPRSDTEEGPHKQSYVGSMGECHTRGLMSVVH